MTDTDQKKRWQIIFRDMGLYNLKIDGDWGRGSQSAHQEAIKKGIVGEKIFDLPICFSNKVQPDFISKTIDISNALKMNQAGPDQLMACMGWESGETFSPSIRNGAGSGACVDIETEILTTRGWKKYHEVEIGTEVYSINYSRENGIMEIDSIQDIIIKESENNYAMSSRSFDSLSTHDHRWYLLQRFYQRTNNAPEILVKTTEEIVNLKNSNNYFIPHIKPSDIDKTIIKRKFHPLLYKLLGLIAGDGSINKERGRIELVCDSRNEQQMTAICTALEEVFPEGVAFDNTKSGPFLIRWRFNSQQSKFLLEFFDNDYNSQLNQTKYVKKLCPDVFDELDFEAAHNLIWGYIATDGHVRNNGKFISFRNTEKTIIDDFMHAAVLAGENPRLTQVCKRDGQLHKFPDRDKEYQVKDIYTVYLRDARYTSCMKDQLKIEPSTEKITVWCPTLKNSNWIARRNGTVYVTGNCGLIQFMPFVALTFFYPQKDIKKMSKEEKKIKGKECCDMLAAMTAVEQLDKVFEYFKPYTGKLDSLADVYMAILWPAAIGKPLDYVLFDKAKSEIAYRQNSGIDINKDSKCTKGEAATKVTEKMIRGFKLLK